MLLATRMRIDVHTHTFPARIARSALEKLQRMSGTKLFSDGTNEGLRRQMTQAGLDYAVIQPVATDARQVPHINDSAIRINGQALQTGILSFGCMHPDYEEPETELFRLADAGVRGIKLHPPYQGADMDDPRYLRILDAAGACGLAVLIHAGLDVGLPGINSSTPKKLLRALRAVGPVTLILAHMGGWRCWEQAEALLAGTGVYLDTSFSLGLLPTIRDDISREELQMLTDEQFVRMVHAFGAKHVLFGSDSPWSDQSAELHKVLDLPLTEEEKQAILGGNAAALLGIA